MAVEEYEGERLAINARRFFDITKVLPEESVLQMDMVDQRLELRAGRSKFSINILPADDFPDIEKIAVEHALKIGAADLLLLLNTTITAAGKQDARFYLNGVHLHHEKGHTEAAGTDGHRLAVTTHCTAEGTTSFDIIIPTKAVSTLIKLLAASEDEVRMEVGSGFCRVLFADGAVLHSSLVDGKYPDYKRVIPPRDHMHTATLATPELRAALHRAGILVKSESGAIKTSFSQNKLHVSAENREQETAGEEIPIQYTGPDISIGMNVNYLLDALLAQPDETRLYLQDAQTSVLITSDATPHIRHVVMPVRL